MFGPAPNGNLDFDGADFASLLGLDSVPPPFQYTPLNEPSVYFQPTPPTLNPGHHFPSTSYPSATQEHAAPTSAYASVGPSSPATFSFNVSPGPTFARAPATLPMNFSFPTYAAAPPALDATTPPVRPAYTPFHGSETPYSFGVDQNAPFSFYSNLTSEAFAAEAHRRGSGRGRG